MVATGVNEMHAASQPGLVIAMDGPSGSGKSTVARRVAAELGLRYLDTGAMYRAMTWWLRQHGVDVDDPDAVVARLREPRITVGTDPESPSIAVDGADVAGPIRTRDISNSVSSVAAIPQVRELLIGQQRDIIAAATAAGAGIVAEGRDIGTVVAPDAAVKFFITATEQVRAQRRSAELADPDATADATRREQAVRDQRDAPQSAVAADAVLVDTSAMDLDQVVLYVTRLARARRAVAHG